MSFRRRKKGKRGEDEDDDDDDQPAQSAKQPDLISENDILAVLKSTIPDCNDDGFLAQLAHHMHKPLSAQCNVGIVFIFIVWWAYIRLLI